MRWLRCVSIGFVLAFLFAGVAAAEPNVSMTASTYKLPPEGMVTFTIPVAVPVTDTATIVDASIRYVAPPELVITAAGGPLLVVNSCTLTWHDEGSTEVQSKTASSPPVRIVGRTKEITPVGKTVDIPMGTLAPGESESASITVERAPAP